MDTNTTTLQSMIAAAEAVAAQKEANRSRLRSQALQQHGKRLDSERITDALNAVYRSESSRLHPSWQQLQWTVVLQ